MRPFLRLSCPGEHSVNGDFPSEGSRKNSLIRQEYHDRGESREGRPLSTSPMGLPMGFVWSMQISP